MAKDWTGNTHSVLVTHAPINHTNAERASDDYYATDPRNLEELLQYEHFSKNVWECAAGGGHLVKVLREHGHEVKATDIADRGCPGYEYLDFLQNDGKFDGDIITNPPYRYTTDFIIKALEAVPDGHKVAMLLRLQSLEGVDRYERVFRENPPRYVYVFVSRHICAPNGKFEEVTGSAVAYCWFVWVKGYRGEPNIRWIPPKEKKKK